MSKDAPDGAGQTRTVLATSHYALDLRFSQPGSDTDVRLSRDGTAAIHIDFEHLRGFTLEPDVYDRALGASLFADRDVQCLCAQTFCVAQTHEVPLRLRLCPHANAPKLESTKKSGVGHPNGE